jgi:hypothetical protein
MGPRGPTVLELALSPIGHPALVVKVPGFYNDIML